MTHQNNTTVAELAEPFIGAIERLTAVADRLEGLDLAHLTDETRRAVLAVDRAVREPAQAVTLRARFGLRAEQRHLADAITPLFVALAGTMPVLDQMMFTDAEAIGLRLGGGDRSHPNSDPVPPGSLQAWRNSHPKRVQPAQRDGALL